MEGCGVTHRIVSQMEGFVRNGVASVGELGSTKNPVLARVAVAALIPISFMARSVDAAAGCVCFIGVICTLAKYEPLYQAAIKLSAHANFMIAHPFVKFLQVFNPQAQCVVRLPKVKADKISNYRPPIIYINDNGLLSNLVRKYLLDIALRNTRSTRVFRKEVVSRFTYGVLGASCLVARAVDGVVAIPLASLSILTLGRNPQLNTLAFNALQVTGVVSDQIFCLICILNPMVAIQKNLD